MGIKKKLAMAVTTTALGAAIMASGSFALFSATTANTNNTFASGTVKLNATNAQVWSTQANVSNLAPGDSGTFGTLTLANTGTLDEWVTLSTVTAAVDGKADIFADTATNATVDSLAIKYTVTVTDRKTGTSTTDGVLGDTKDILVPAGDTATVTYTYAFPSTAGNEYQGASGTITFAASAVQEAHNSNASKTAPVSKG